MEKSKGKVIKLAVVALASILMLAFFFIEPLAGLDKVGMKFLGIFIWWIVLMITEPIPNYLACLMALVVAVSAKCTDLNGAFASFGQSTCWLLIGAFGIATGLGNSGILNRVALMVMKMFPGTYVGQLWAVSIASFVVAPTVPSTTAKCTILMPIVGSISDELGYEPHSKGAAGLLSCTNTVTNYCGVTFMTGGLLAASMLAMYSGTFTWMGWLKFAVVWGIVLFVTTVLFHQFYYNPNKGVKKEDIKPLDKAVIQERIDALGKMQKKEIISLIVLLVTILLWVTEGTHGIPTAIVALGAWGVLCCAGLFTPADFSTKILWTIWAMVGGILGINTLLSTTGVSAWIGNLASPLVSLISGSPLIVIMGCAIISCGLMFCMVNYMITSVLFVTMLAATGIDPICIIFAVFMGGAVFVLPFQQVFVIAAVGVSGGRIEHKDIVPGAWAYVVCNLLALLASVPYWNMLGLFG